MFINDKSSFFQSYPLSYNEWISSISLNESQKYQWIDHQNSKKAKCSDVKAISELIKFMNRLMINYYFCVHPFFLKVNTTFSLLKFIHYIFIQASFQLFSGKTNTRTDSTFYQCFKLFFCILTPGDILKFLKLLFSRCSFLLNL